MIDGIEDNILFISYYISQVVREYICEELEENQELKEQLIKHGDDETLNNIADLFYEFGAHHKYIPIIIKNLFTSEDKLAKFKDPSQRRINKKHILQDILMGR